MIWLPWKKFSRYKVENMEQSVSINKTETFTEPEWCITKLGKMMREYGSHPW